MSRTGYQSAVAEAAFGVGSFVFREEPEADGDLRAVKKLVVGDNPFVPGFERHPLNGPRASTVRDSRNWNPLSLNPSRVGTNCIFGSKNGIADLNHAPLPRQPSIPINSTFSDRHGAPEFSWAWTLREIAMREIRFTKFSAACPSCEIKVACLTSPPPPAKSDPSASSDPHSEPLRGRSSKFQVQSSKFRFGRLVCNPGNRLSILQSRGTGAPF